jgi:hypothetical protein
VVLGHAAILAEAFACAGKTAVNLEVRCDVIASGGANSTAFQRFRFSLTNAHKNPRYAPRMTGEAKVVSFIGDAVHNTYTVAGNLGYTTQFIPPRVSSLTPSMASAAPVDRAQSSALSQVTTWLVATSGVSAWPALTRVSARARFSHGCVIRTA